MSGMIFTKILKCDNCLALIKETSGGLHSVGFGINLFNKLKWSDGKEYKTIGNLIGNISFINPELIKCHSCKELLWRTDLEVIISSSNSSYILDLDKKSIIDNAQKYIEPQYKDYIKFAEKKVRKEYSKYCRIEAWHISNDKRRIRNKKYTSLALDEKEIDNLLKLLEILSDEEDCLLKVEIYRELGKFDKSLAVLTNNYSEDKDHYDLFYSLNVLQIRELIVYGEKSIRLN